MRAGLCQANKIIGEFIDRCTLGRYYTSALKMDTNYLDSYGPLLLMFILAGGLAGVLITASTIVGKHKHIRRKGSALRMRNEAHRRRARAVFRALLHGGAALHFV